MPTKQAPIRPGQGTLRAGEFHGQKKGTMQTPPRPGFTDKAVTATTGAKLK
jgi:hypothetical protein